MGPRIPERGPAAWRPVQTDDGSWTLAHPGHGETCHSRAGAWLEARERYALPCRLAERAAELAGARALRVLDVGTGPGWNLAAALAAVAGSGTPLFVDTLESDPDVVRAGLELPAEPPAAAEWFEAARSALREALRAPGRGVAFGPGPGDGGGLAQRGERGLLALHLGDARRTLPALGPEAVFDAVFLDSFSPAREGALYEPAFLAEVARRMRPEALLSTFTSAFAVRRALCESGLIVGRGPAVGTKRSGTLASPRAPLPALRAPVAARLAQFAPPGGGKRGPIA